jgi:hypothetical protein
MKHMKTNAISRWLIALALTAAIAVAAFAQQYDPESDFQVRRINNDKEVEITAYVGSETDIRIPPRIQNLPVTSISKGVFPRDITSVTIPNSVTSIGQYAFSGCASLASVTIGNGVTSLNGFDFQNNTNLTSVTIGNGVTSIGSSAFAGCTSLASITIPASVTSIGDGAFVSTKLTSVTFEGTIPSSGLAVSRRASIFDSYEGGTPFDGDLRVKYLAGGRGTYTAPIDPYGHNMRDWTKQ